MAEPYQEALPLVHGDMEYSILHWNNLIWGANHKTVTSYDPDDYSSTAGPSFASADHVFLKMYATTDALYAFTRDDGGSGTHQLERTTTGTGTFTEVLEIGTEENFGLHRSLVEIDSDTLLFFEYEEAIRVWVSTDSGENWSVLLTAFTGSVRHFHGAIYDAANATLYVMTGDTDDESTILFCDDVPDLLANAGTWRTAWGLDQDSSTRTPSTSYTLAVSGVYQSQATRAVDMICVGDHIYWGEDTSTTAGVKIHRAHRTTHATETVATGLHGQAWKLDYSAEGVLALATNSFCSTGSPGTYESGQDGYTRIYASSSPFTSWAEVARLARSDIALPSGPAHPNGFFFNGNIIWWWSTRPPATRDYAGLLTMRSNSESWLELRLKLDGTTGTNAPDSSPNNLDGTLTSLSWDDDTVVVQVGSALQFTGEQGEYIAGDDDAVLDFTTQDFSIAFWAYINSGESGDEYILSRTTDYVGAGNGWAVFYRNSNTALQIRTFNASGGAVTYKTIASKLDAWHHYCFSRTRSTVEMYVDGVDYSPIQGDHGIDASTPLSVDAAYLVGSPADGSSSVFTGVLDDVRVYSKALTAAETLAIMTPATIAGTRLQTGLNLNL